MTRGLSGFRRPCAYTISPYIHATFSSSGFQSLNFLNALRFSPEMGSVASAVASPPRSGSMKRYWRIPLDSQIETAARSAISSGTEQITKDEMSSGLPKRIPAS